MLETLLQTKIFIPPARDELVSRQRLLDQLASTLSYKLTLISAPAGFGKTTLAAEWIRQMKIRSCWISLDEADNDLSRFMVYLAAAFKDIMPDLDYDQILSSTLSTQLSAEYLLPPLINAAAEFNEDCILILDDYHLVTSKKIHDVVGFLLDNMPPCMHLMILTRADPPLQLPRLRARGQLFEIRAAALRFTADEASQFLKNMMDLDLSIQDLNSLLDHTEGWIAGLQMAAISMRGRSDLSTFVNNFTGSNRYILDFLLEEVFECQSERIKRFLLQTSILDQLCSSLCQAVTGEEDSQILLQQIEKENLFIVPLDQERCWYRYHRLFEDLLRQRLQTVYPDVVTQLHIKAGNWYEENGQIQFAITHTILAEVYDKALHLIETVAEDTLMRSEVSSFLSWVSKIPADKILSHPRICLYKAWALIIGGHPIRDAHELLQKIDVADEEIGSGVALMQAFSGIYSGDLKHSMDVARDALAALPVSETFFRSVAGWILGVGHLLSGDTNAADGAFDEVFRVGEQTGNMLLTVMALCHTAEIRRTKGEFGDAKKLYLRAKDLAVDANGNPLPVYGMVLIGLGELYREWNDLDKASQLVLEGLAQVKNWGKFAALDGYISLARIRQGQGDWDAARAAIREAQQIAVEFDATDIDDRVVASYKTRLALAQGDLDTALRWVETHPLDSDAFTSIGNEFADISDFFMTQHEMLTLARIKMFQHQYSDALLILEPLLAQLEDQKYTGAVVKLLALIALAYQGKGDQNRALHAIEKAVLLSAEQKFVRTFLDEGQPMVHLLELATSRQPYARTLLNIMNQELVADKEKETAQMDLWLEPLSEREKQILILLATNLSVPEISERLVVAPSTTRSHIKSIYRKLDTHSRFETIEKARQLGLLPGQA